MPDIDIDVAILNKLNEGGRLGKDNGRSRRADRIVAIQIKIIKINEFHEVMYEDSGERTGEEQYYSFENCGSLNETRQYQTTFTKEHSAELEMTNVVKTSTAFTGKLTTSCTIPWADMKLGTEGTASFSKDFTVTDRNKQTSSTKEEDVEKWELTAPPHTRVMYKVATVNGNKRVQFSGVVIVTGIYHYVIDQVWDQNANIEAALPDEKDRTFDFTGILTTINFSKFDFAKTEEALTPDYCAAKAKAMPDHQLEPVMLDQEVGKAKFDAGVPEAA